MWYDTGAQELKLYDSVGVWQLVWPIPEEVIVSPSQPPTEIGLLWHNTAVNKLYICDTAGTWQLVWPTPEEVIVSPVQPAYETGLLWHNTATNKLYICDTNNAWQLVWPIPEEVIVSPNQPANETGLLWHNTAANQLRICDVNNIWQLVWPIPEEVIVSPNQPANEIGLLWHNTAVNKLYICDTAGTWQLVWPIEQPYPAVWVSNPSTLIGAGICLAVGAQWYQYDTGNGDGVAIFRGRDFATEAGGVTIPSGSNPPAYLSYSYTNPTNQSVLFEADLTGHGNLYYGLPNAAFGLVYTIGENLNITMPAGYSGNGDPNLQGTMRQDVYSSGLNTRSAGGFDVYTESTVSGARFFKVIPPGGTVTVYAQWWGILYQAHSWNGYAVIHGNMAMKVKVTRGGAYL
jgi:hypothetical protein